MDINSIMGAQLGQLQQAVGLSMLNMAKSMQTAGATMMLQDFTENQNKIQQAAPHPTLGQSIDFRA